MGRRATVITDASYDPVSGVAGWAAWIRIDEVPGAIKRAGVLRERALDSLDAEMRASAIGVFLALQFNVSAILLQTDCLAVIHALKHRGVRSKHWWDLIRTIEAEHVPIIGRHVKGHTKNPAARSWVNRWCDDQARKNMREARDALRRL